MDPIKQKIAIAKACGWTPIDCGSPLTVWKHPETPKNVALGEKDIIHSSFLPDYLNDLNAMHEAEKMLTNNQLYEYQLQLNRICETNWPHPEKSENFYASTFLPAVQRAEAFLRTLNLWTTET